MPTLNWIGKEAVVNHDQQVPFHLLKDVPETGCGDPGGGNLIVEGGYLFKKHYFGPKPGELMEKTSAGGYTEEFQCAMFLDGLPGVKYWVRNISGRSTAFRLQTSTDWFYPDFVCQMEDGRVFVVEYKGAHLFADAEEKRAVGAVWESRSNGRCRFFMPQKLDFEEIRRAATSGRGAA